MTATVLRLATIGLLAGALPQAPATAPPPSATKMVLKGKAPVSNEVLKVKLPRPQEADLANGLHLMVLEDRRLPQITFTLLIRGAGGYFDPADKIGLANYTASLMREGTKTRTSPQISEALETMAATLNVASGLSGTTASLSGSSLSENFDKLMDLTAEVLLSPSFDPGEWDRFKTRTKAGLIQQRTNRLCDVGRIGIVNFRRDFQRQARAAGDLDRAVHALLRREPADEGQIAAVSRAGSQQVARQTVMDGAQPCRVRPGPALGLGNGDQRRVRIARVELRRIEIQPAVQRRQMRRQARIQRKVQIAAVEMDHVEIVRLVEHGLELQCPPQLRIADTALAAQSLRTARVQLHARGGIAGGEQGDFVPRYGERFREVGDDPLGAAVLAWWNRFRERCDLRNAQGLACGRALAHPDARPRPLQAVFFTGLRHRTHDGFRTRQNFSASAQKIRRAVAIAWT